MVRAECEDRVSTLWEHGRHGSAGCAVEHDQGLAACATWLAGERTCVLSLHVADGSGRLADCGPASIARGAHANLRPSLSQLWITSRGWSDRQPPTAPVGCCAGGPSNGVTDGGFCVASPSVIWWCWVFPRRLLASV